MDVFRKVSVWKPTAEGRQGGTWQRLETSDACVCARCLGNSTLEESLVQLAEGAQLPLVTS